MTLPKVYVGIPIQEVGLKLLRGNVDFKVLEKNGVPPRDELLRDLRDVEGLLGSIPIRVDAELFDAAPKLRVVSNYAVGYDNIDVPEATKRGICITNTPDVLTPATADLAFSLILASARRLIEANAFLRSGDWKVWGPELLVGQEVAGSTIGIIGMGNIGQAVAKRARGFDMKVLYFSRSRCPEAESTLDAKYVPLVELLRESDFVSLHCPLTESTRGLIGAKELRSMKKTAILINTARGPLVDPQALYTACAEGWIWGAGLDVFVKEPVPLDEPLLKLVNVTTFPHIGSASRIARDGMAIRSAENLLSVLQGKKPRDLVNKEVWK
ncbi:2-hydroxyacid dehydrogenase [Treponema primitia]|uniref:2-hydroxyacid dehydrogenase n=1 Tax=Treponema primitia TaxID=88058 RepID=UPI0002554D80|nr:D-glycerate dehydrogenase [Treponema primitia]